MRCRSLAIAVVLLSAAPPVAAQGDASKAPPKEEAAEAPHGDEDEGPSTDEQQVRPEQPSDAADAPEGEPTPGEPSQPPPSQPAEPEPAEPPPVSRAPAPPPSPDPAGRRAPIKRLQGALVIARSAEARQDAKHLARLVYRDARLRPNMAESMAQVLVGAPAKTGDARQAEVAALVKALAAVDDDTVRRRLLTSLAEDLGAQLVVEVAVQEDGRPRARVLRLPDERFLGVTLTPTQQGEPPVWAWDDAVGILRGLLVGPPPGPRTQPASGTAATAPSKGDDGESDWDLLKSPWFWGGLGVVVTVGVTVLILSQTALNEPDTVMLEGRVGP